MTLGLARQGHSRPAEYKALEGTIDWRMEHVSGSTHPLSASDAGQHQGCRGLNDVHEPMDRFNATAFRPL